MLRLYQGLLVLAIVAVVYQLMGPDGALARERELAQTLEVQKAMNAEEKSKNDKLAAELYSLENRKDAIEERARRELFMVRNDEVLFRIERPEEAAKRDQSVASMPDYSHPDIPPGTRPTFRPQHDHLYFAPKNLRAPPSRDKRK